MQILKSWTGAERGRLAALAKHLGISPPNVVAWITGNKPVPMIHAAGIEIFTCGTITRREMFPDSWQRIWPELAGAEKVDEGASHG